MNILSLITEAVSMLGEAFQTKHQGVEHSKDAPKTNHTKAPKSRVKVYKSINDGLKKGYLGQMFSTHNSDRLYVVTKHKWGKKKQQTISGRTAKGFTGGDYKSVSGYAMRTMSRYGGQKPSGGRQKRRTQRGQRGRK